MSIFTKQNQTHRQRKQTWGYQTGDERREVQMRAMRLTGTNYVKQARIYYIRQGTRPIL